jgi:hypothetical protein
MDGYLSGTEICAIVSRAVSALHSQALRNDGGVIMKQVALAVGAVLLLAACSHDVRMDVPLGTAVAPGVAPWLQVAKGPEQVEVKGLERKLVLTPAPALADALQSSLRRALAPDYFTDLTVGCDSLDAGMKVDRDDAPGKVAMNLSLHCTINARGYVSRHDYAARPTGDVAADADDSAYAHALPGLLEAAAADIAGHLRADIGASKGNPNPGT